MLIRHIRIKIYHFHIAITLCLYFLLSCYNFNNCIAYFISTVTCWAAGRQHQFTNRIFSKLIARISYVKSFMILNAGNL